MEYAMSDEIARQLAAAVATGFVFGRVEGGQIEQVVDTVVQDGTMYLLRAEDSETENADTTSFERV